MGRLLNRAIEQAGLQPIAERALGGAGLVAADLAVLRKVDLLIVAGLADAVRAKHRGDEVAIMTGDAAEREAELHILELDAGRADGPTGQEVLLEVAFARLATPASDAIAVDFESIGLELAQTALTFGADTLVGDLAGKRALPLLDGPAARQRELAGLVERGGRGVRWEGFAASAPVEPPRVGRRS